MAKGCFTSGGWTGCWWPWTQRPARSSGKQPSTPRATGLISALLHSSSMPVTERGERCQKCLSVFPPMPERAVMWTPTAPPRENSCGVSTPRIPRPMPVTLGRLVALDATSGELQWFFQMVHHDLWDFDAAQPTMLFSLNGVPAIEGTTKAGYTFILDRASGESLFPYQEVAVPPTPANAAYQHPWPTQPVSSIESLAELKVEPGTVPAGAVAALEFATPGPTPQVFQPYYTSGYEFPPPAYSPRTQMIYSHALYGATVVKRENVDCPEVAGTVIVTCGTVSP